jgi:two-component system chemotaxis sensor kinase CheA
LARVLRRHGRGAVSSAVLIESGGGLVAVGVERVLSTASVVVRSLPEGTLADDVISGASLDGAGTPQLVLDPAGLAAAAQRQAAESIAPSATRLPILIIDDSLTTRMLERSILESAGYQVELASSAEEGLELAHARPYGLFLVDVEMPGMDGFAFVRRTREDPTLRRTPAILVTSRNAAADRKLGGEVGASDYIVKSEFDQALFLASVRKLVG